MPEISSNPFTPKSGWEPRVFVGRDEEIEFFKKKLKEAREGRCDHFLILGNWGVGKTSLLKEFKRIAQSGNILTSFITISEYTEKNTVMDGVKELVEEIPQRFPTDVSKLKGFVKQLDELGVQVLGSGFTLSRVVEDMQPQPFLFNTLKILWNDLKNETEVAVILLDDMQNFDPISGISTILKNVLSDEEIVKTRFLFILSCTPDGWKQFLVRHHPIGRYFTPRLSLERLSKEETREALDGILENSGVIFDSEIKDRVYEYTEGHPYELQVLCSKLYDNQIGGKVTKDIWDASLNDTLKELGEIVFDGLYRRASYLERRVLYLAALFGEPFEQKDILTISKKTNFSLTENTIKSALSRLNAKNLLIKPDKFKHSPPDKIFKEYILLIKGYDGEGNTLELQELQKLMKIATGATMMKRE